MCVSKTRPPKPKQGSASQPPRHPPLDLSRGQGCSVHGLRRTQGTPQPLGSGRCKKSRPAFVRLQISALSWPGRRYKALVLRGRPHADPVQTPGPPRAAQGFPEAILAPRRRRQQATESSDAVKVAAGSSPAGPEPGTQQQADRGSSPATEPGCSSPQDRQRGWAGSAGEQASLYAGILLLSGFREAQKRGGAAPPLGSSASGWLAQVRSCAVAVWGRPRRSQWSLPDLDTNTG